MNGLDFIKKHLTEREFSGLKDTILNSSDSNITLGEFQFFITRSRISGDEIVSFMSEEDYEVEKEVLYSPNLSFDNLRGIVKGYFEQDKLN